MTADITRYTFDSTKHYRLVRMQQGRVQLDADWNEQVDIDTHHDETEASDVIGDCGAPHHPPGEGKHYQVGAVAGEKDLTIAAGRMYVAGKLIENESERRASVQPDLPADAAIVQVADDTFKALGGLTNNAANKGRYVVYLDVWRRHLTAIDDAAMREVALGGPDTTTRLKTVWQAKLRKVADTVTCTAIPTTSEWQALTAVPTGTLTAQAKKDPASSDPCIVPAESGYRGLENQLYRVQVHEGGSRSAATFKWSRENGSVVSAIERISGDEVRVQNLGRDAKLGFAPGQWVEIVDDRFELLGEPGELVQIDRVDPATRLLTLKTTPTLLAATADGVDPTLHPKLRRWDQTGGGATDGGVKMTATWVPLEDGVEVRFGAGEYRSGDYWLIPARTALGDVEWPRDPSDPTKPSAESPLGVEHDYCPLALVRFTGTEFEMLGDCRELFPSLTSLTSIFHVGGDGQEARPGHELPQPLQAGVANGQWPVAGRRVKFTRLGAGGKLLPGATTVVTSSDAEIVTLTADDGVAECRWQLDTDLGATSQRVEAWLVDDMGAAHHLPVRFNANLSAAREVAYEPPKCKELPDQPGIPTVWALLQKRFADWPEVDSAGNATAKAILDGILCRLDAGGLPYNPTIQSDRWKDIKESDLGSPPEPNNVQDALDQLVRLLESTDISYRPNCGTETSPTVRALLAIPDDADSKIDAVFDKLLCAFTAEHLPIAKSETLCATLNQKSVRTTQDALQALCGKLETRSVATGAVVFENVEPGKSRTSPLIETGLDSRFYAILTAIEFLSDGVSFIYDGDLTDMVASWPSVVTAYSTRSAQQFNVILRDNRDADSGLPPISWRVRWWAVPSTIEHEDVVLPAPPGTGVGGLAPELVLGSVVLRPDRTAAELAVDLGVDASEVTNAVDRLVDLGAVRLTRGRIRPLVNT